MEKQNKGSGNHELWSSRGVTTGVVMNRLSSPGHLECSCLVIRHPWPIRGSVRRDNETSKWVKKFTA